MVVKMDFLIIIAFFSIFISVYSLRGTTFLNLMNIMWFMCLFHIMCRIIFIFGALTTILMLNDMIFI